MATFGVTGAVHPFDCIIGKRTGKLWQKKFNSEILVVYLQGLPQKLFIQSTAALQAYSMWPNARFVLLRGILNLTSASYFCLFVILDTIAYRIVRGFVNILFLTFLLSFKHL